MCTGIFGRQWPPRPTLLGASQRCNSLDFNNKSQWGTDEWRKYALFLEKSGARLNSELTKIKAELYVIKGKASRRKKPFKQSIGSLLTSEPEPKLKSGRKHSKDRERVVNAVIEKYNEMKADPLCKRASVSGALEKVLAGSGIRPQDKRTILNDRRLKGLKKS